MTSGSDRFSQTRLVRDGGSGKVLLECRAVGAKPRARRLSWTIYDGKKGRTLMHVTLSKGSWLQRRRNRGERGGRAGGGAAPPPPRWCAGHARLRGTVRGWQPTG